MCFYEDRIKSSNSRKELSLEEIEQISLKMPPFNWLQISGGEPFLRSDLDKICGCFINNSRAKIISIPTNGYYVDKICDLTRRMVTSYPKIFFTIGISIYGPKNLHDKITGIPGSFDKAISAYWKLKELAKRHSNLGLNFGICQNKQNEDSLNELFSYLMTECSPDHISLLFARGIDVKHKFTGTSYQKYKENWDYLLTHVLKRDKYYYLLPFKSILYSVNMLQKDITYEVAYNEKFVLPCYAARISGVIDENGDVFSCEMRKAKLGSLRDNEYDFRNIWKGEVAKRERTQIRKSKCYCTHECFITSNIVFNPLMYYRLFKKWLIYNHNFDAGKR